MKEIPLDQPIAQGRTAAVYDWDEGHILKLFHNWFPLRDVEYELKITRAVHASGVKSPAVGELIQVRGRNGLVYERVPGESMLAMFRRKPWLVVRYARIFAELHAQMHEKAFEADVPTLHGKLQYRIEHLDVPASLKTSLLDALHSLPEADRVCHGDFHPDNLLISGSDANIIDWIDASRGNPLADVARTSVILRGVAASSQIPNPILKLFVKSFHSVYLSRYFRLRPGGQAEYRRWLPIVAAARLDEGIKELEGWLLEQAKRGE
ncbi:MAG TPA: aminoglycoside phosphotransferase family protein [Anaerolineales bacterium]|nr:aminoglycoside phosphotransferase family protein [Anaerolineales bacterium]